MQEDASLTQDDTSIMLSLNLPAVHVYKEIVHTSCPHSIVVQRFEENVDVQTLAALNLTELFFR